VCYDYQSSSSDIPSHNDWVYHFKFSEGVMKIRFIPEVDPEEKIFGVQFVLENYAIDIYFCFAIFKIGIFRNKGECWSILLGFFRIEGTNLNMGW